MKLSTIIIALLVFGALITGMYSFINSVGHEYGVAEETEYVEAFGQSQELADEMNNNYLNIVGNLSAKKSSAYQIITLVPDAIMIVINMIELPFQIVFAMVTNLSTSIGLAGIFPAWFMTFIVSIIIVFLVFAVINFIKGGES